MSVSHRRSFFVWIVLCTLAGLLFMLYSFTSVAAGRGELLMPMDDVYIHFQYAHQLAQRQPYVYNPGLPPSSGATSLLYPWLLALGDLLGFKGLLLGVWAMAMGAFAMVGSAWLIYRMTLLFHAPWGIGLGVSITFMLTGAVAWHSLSGMETGLMMFAVLLTLYMVVRQQFTGGLLSAALLTLVRPEGTLLGLIAAGIVILQHFRALHARQWLLLGIPLAGAALQPVINVLITGSAVASGNQAKSILGMIPADQSVMISRIVENLVRIWSEFATGISPREGVYLPWFIPTFALLGIVALLLNPKYRLSLLLIIGWLGAGTLAVATLDPAFWHFKRYQMPFMALFYPLAGWGIASLWRVRNQLWRGVLITLCAITLTGVLVSSRQFLEHFALNVGYVADQPLQMARWLQQNTPSNAVVAVHDVGLIRYLSGRTTVDMVGLTTTGAADAWRNGPGSVAEFLEKTQPRPDFVASYTDARGLSYLADTGIYGQELALYRVPVSDQYNVALAAAEQGIFRADWSDAVPSYSPHQPYSLALIEADAEVIDQIDVADLNSESQHQYTWSERERLPGFATEVYELDTPACVENCRVLDGGRRINGEEAFILTVPPELQGRNLILLTRVHPAHSGTFEVMVNDQSLGIRSIPFVPGLWLEIPTLIPAETVTGRLHIRIIPDVPGGHYMPYMHWLYAFEGTLQTSVETPIGTFSQNTILLNRAEYRYNQEAQQLDVDLDWVTLSGAAGDAMVFVHVYDENGELAAQADVRPGSGTLSPGNWVPGFSFHDRVVVNLAELQTGLYRVALGLYDPLTGNRLMTAQGDSDNRLWLGELEIPTHE